MEDGLMAPNGCESCRTCADQTLRASFEDIIVDVEAEAFFPAPAPQILRGPEGLVEARVVMLKKNEPPCLHCFL